MYQQQQHQLLGVPIQTVGYNPFANMKFSTTGPAYPSPPQSSARRAFRSAPPAAAKQCNMAQLLPRELRSTSVSSTSSGEVTNAWSRSHSLAQTQAPQQPPQQRSQRRNSTASVAQSRRNSTTSVVSQPQNGWASRSRTPESRNKPAACKGRKINKATAPKKTQKAAKKQQRRTKEENIRAIYAKGEKVGQLSNNKWFKAPKNGRPPAPKPARKNQQRPAAKKQSTVRRQAKRQATNVRRQPTRVAPETLKALKKLRKKVKQCAKIQERIDMGLRMEVNELEKVKQLNDFKQQIAVLEAQVSTGKVRDNQGFQVVKQRRR